MIEEPFNMLGRLNKSYIEEMLAEVFRALPRRNLAELLPRLAMVKALTRLGWHVASQMVERSAKADREEVRNEQETTSAEANQTEEESRMVQEGLRPETPPADVGGTPKGV